MAVDENFTFIYRALLAAAEQRLPATHDLEQLSHRCDAELVVMYLVAFITDNAGDLSALLLVLHVGEDSSRDPSRDLKMNEILP